LVCVGLSAAAGIRREAGNCVKEPLRESAALTGMTIVPKHLTRNRNG
jgi:hypothetical protein